MPFSRRDLIHGTLAGAAGVVAASSTWGTALAQTSSPPAPGPVSESSIPSGALTAVNDLLDHGAHLRPGQKVLIIAYLDGLYGGDNIVDATAIHWISGAIQQRGNPLEVLWVDQPSRFGEWQFPDYVRSAMDRADVTINHSFDLVVEEIMAFRRYAETDNTKPMVRNFATTAPLLSTAWAQTPQELVSEIRYQASLHIQTGAKWVMTDPNGTHLEGTIMPARNPKLGYAVRREAGTYLPWPEWVCPPINLSGTSGTFIFDRTLSWWSRYIGINPYFDKPVTLTIKDGRILQISGGTEADAIRRFVNLMKEKLGETAYAFDTLHFGVHPQAHVAPQQCPSVLYRRLIEHSDAHNIHVHIGSARATTAFPYWPHITGDIRHATFTIGDFVMHRDGRLTVLDDPAVKAIEARYPGRPGVEPQPFQG